MSENTTPPNDNSSKSKRPKWSLWALPGILLRWLSIAVVAVFLILQLPFVQQYLADQVVIRMEKGLGTTVTLESVRVRWLDELDLRNLYIEDVYGDTLLASGQLIANFNLNPLAIYQRGIEVEALSINGARFNIRRSPGDSLTNLQVALAKLLPARSPDTARNTIAFNLKELNLDDVQFTQQDSINGSYLGVYLPAAQIYVNGLDLPNKHIDINSINIQRPVIQMSNWQGTPLPDHLQQLDSLVQAAVDSSTFYLAIGEFRLESGSFQLDNYRKAPVKTTPANQLDLKHLDLYDIHVEVDSFLLQDDTYRGRINWIVAKDRSGFKLDRLSSKEVIVSPRVVVFNGLAIITPTSSLGDTLAFRYRSYADWSAFEDRVKIDARFHDADVTLKDIMAFVPKLNDNPFFAANRNTNLKLDGQLSGGVNNLRGKDVRVSLADGTRLEGKFSSQNLAVPHEEFLILELNDLTTRVSTLRQLIPNFNPPPAFDRLGRLRFSGKFIGFFIDFVANGELYTDLGRAGMDMQMVLLEGANRAHYSGNLRLMDFDLGAWTTNPDFGIVNFSSKVIDGFGLTTDLATADLEAEIKSFAFKGYNYENATLTGRLNKNFFNGALAINDDNIKLRFTGELDFRDTIPTFDFKADVDRLALQALNLTKQELVLAGKVDINLKNSVFSKMEGEIKMSSIHLEKGTTEAYDIDYINAFSFFDSNGEKVFRLNSDIAKGEIRGAFDINELPASLTLFMLRNYPGFADRLGFKPPKRIPDVNQFSFDLHLADSKGLYYLVSPNLGPLKEVDLNGRYNGLNDSLLLFLEIPRLEIGQIRLADVYLHIDALEREGDLDIVVDSTFINGKPLLNTFTLLSILQGDTIDFAINLSTDTPNIFDEVNLNGLFYLPDSTDYILKLRQSNLSLLKFPWTIEEDNSIRFGQGRVQAENFALSNKDRKIRILNNGDKGLRFLFTNFNFNFIDQLWDYDPLNFSGNFDMVLQLDDVFKLKGINAAITGENLYINKDDYGQFRLDANVADLQSQVTTQLYIAKDTTVLEVSGLFNLADIGTKTTLKRNLPPRQQKNYLDLKMNFTGFPMAIAEYWLGGGLTDTHGYFGADLRVAGVPEDLNISGFIDARDGGFTLASLHTHYTFKKGLLKASNNLFDATGIVMYDKYGNSAEMEGGITHDRLRDLGLNASLKTRRFLGLDLPKNEDNVFYGRALGSGEVFFSGDFLRPNIYVNATVADSTYIIIPINDQAESRDLNFVRFINRHQGTNQTVSTVDTKIKGLKLEMDLQITEKADLELIFDEQAGDILKGQGRGNLRILLPRAESFQMYGDITVTQGSYLFTLFEVINKDFRISPGGKIIWTGNPYQAQINIQAEYKNLKSSVSNFIPEFLANESDNLKREAQQTTDVDLLLQLKGDLFAPEISFDINFPNLQGVLENYTDSKLTLLRRDQNEMNKQAFGLIVLGQFLPSDLSFNSNETIFNTLSSYLTNQFSMLVKDIFSKYYGEGKTLSSFDVKLNYNRVSVTDLTGNQGFTTGDAVEFSLRSGFLNDRISFDVGGNFAFGQSSQNGTFFGEDLALEYAISANRDLKLRIYERRDHDIGGDRRIQVGTGLSWRKEFNSFSEFWQSMRKQ